LAEAASSPAFRSPGRVTDKTGQNLAASVLAGFVTRLMRGDLEVTDMTNPPQMALGIRGELMLFPRESGIEIEVLDSHTRRRLVPWSELERIGVGPIRDSISARLASRIKRTGNDGVTDRAASVADFLDTKLLVLRVLLREIEVLRNELAELAELPDIEVIDDGDLG
jgi:hypothetical protein